MPPRVVITGTGIVSPLGNSRAQLFAELCEGRTGLKQTERFADGPMRGAVTGEISAFDAREIVGEGNFRPLDRTSQLLIAATKLALQDSGWSSDMLQRDEVGLVVGTMFCSVHTISEFDRRSLVEGPKYASPLDFANTVINAAAGQTAIWHSLRGVNSTISAGIPSGLQALAYATDLIRSDRVHAVLAGGVEELCFESLYGFRRANLTCPIDEPRPYPFAPDRNGFALSEGTGMLMLESEDAAAARNAEVLAVVLGHGSSFAASGAGQAITRAIRTSLNDAGLSPSDVDLVSASANGSCADQNESEALADVFRGCSPAPVVTAIKSMVGESLGASAAWQTIIAIEILSGGRIPGPYGLDPAEPGRGKLAVPSSTCQRIVRNALINSVGIDGNCCAFVLGEPHNNRSASGSSTHVSR